MKKISAVCVYCGTGTGVIADYRQAAEKLGQLLAREKVRLIYGGGRIGLMGIVSEACFSNGGTVIGIIPEHIQSREIKNADVTEMHVVDSMHTRKRMMVEKSDGFVVLPGGFGTLDEAFEIMTWKYLGLHDKPVVFVNANGFFDPLFKMVDHMVDAGFTPFWHRNLYNIVEDPQQVLSVLSAQQEHIRPNTQKF